MTDTRRTFLAQVTAICGATFLPPILPVLQRESPQPAPKRDRRLLFPEDFGAVGDGVHDDSYAWIACMAEAKAIKKAFPKAEVTVICAPLAIYTFHRAVDLCDMTITAISRKGIHALEGELI